MTKGIGQWKAHTCVKKTEYTYQNINKLNSCDNDKKSFKKNYIVEIK